jgi:hypothetical protein
MVRNFAEPLAYDTGNRSGDTVILILILLGCSSLLQTAVAQKSDLSLNDTLTYLKEHLEADANYAAPLKVGSYTGQCRFLDIEPDGTVAIKNSDRFSIPNNESSDSDALTFKLQDMDCGSVRVQRYDAAYVHYYSVFCNTYLNRANVSYTHDWWDSHNGGHTNPTLQMNYMWFSFFREEKAAIRFAQALKHAIVKSGAKLDEFDENCENTAVPVTVPTPRPGFSQSPQGNPIQKPTPKVAQAPFLPVKVSLDNINKPNSTTLVIDNSASDRDSIVSILVEYQDTSGKWYTKVQGDVPIDKRSVIREELWNNGAQDWRVTKKGEAPAH